MKDNRFQTNTDKEDNGFTGMPNAKFPDFEPEQDGKKQVMQFQNSTEARKKPCTNDKK
ncbi:hypothetical protein QTL97_08055 [Sporosarcina thermotolerans]|uniref:Uncharacterized protein n=1 Tax=Sporosarcina thermotolerans TaxID=633404 RepID=A0AAW9ACQ3_9BACL|nr:hypothetical protein [Sporosarcina thermotolerans]MDW0116883.1 hypothetical protein [Sporosarcina thermotolerans]WHT47993.1 hypothetical protein QNH10_18335 [Sporosarcina thermotolerans]